MAKARRTLKVYQARFGFYDSVVAAPNQRAALDAWGARQNLFAEGAAKLAGDPRAIKAAQAHPETPLRRAIGSDGPFGLDAGTPHLPEAPAPKVRKGKAAPPPKPPPDRTKLRAAEDALDRAKNDETREAETLRRKRQALDAEEAGLKVRWRSRRADAEQALDRERRAYRKAGGNDRPA